jgi:DNA invertase Pin-like site-specific DNA recombinase
MPAARLEGRIMNTTKTRLYSYARFSSDRQKEGDSIHRQLTLAEEFVATHPQYNLQLVNVYQDEGRSAHHGKHLTVGRLGKFLADVKSGRIEKGSWLGCEDFDRLNRQNWWDAKAIFEEIINAGIVVVTFRDGKVFDLQSLRSHPYDFMGSIMSMVSANEYTERMSSRAKAVWKSKRKSAVATGKIMSGNVVRWVDAIVDERSPTGRVLKQHFELNEDKAAIVRQLCDLFLSGMGPQTIARKFNLDGVKTLRKGKYWGPANVRAVLNNQALCGRYVQRVKKSKVGYAASTADPVIIESYYPPLISCKSYSEIQLLLKSNNNTKLRPCPIPANPLQGLCRCSECGSRMTRVSQPAYRGRKAYQKLVCIAGKNGKHKYRSIEVDHVLGHLNMLLQFPKSFNPDVYDAMTPLQAKLADIDRKIERVTDAIAAMGISVALQRSLAGLESDRAAVVAQIEVEASKAVYGDSKRMAELTTEVKAALKSRSADAATINGLLRRMFKSLKVDIEAGEVFAEWQDGKMSVLTV